MRNFICNGEKYACDKGYVYLPIKRMPELPRVINIDGNNLTLKSSFHVSLICIKDLIPKYQRENLEEEIIKSFCEFVSENDISFVKFTGEFRLARFQERKAIVARCEVSNLENLSRHLSEKLSIEIPMQPTHVTLYTLQPDLGVGLNSFEELESKSETINAPVEIRNILN